ncbi:MAG: hypothetical protein IJX05_02955 [Clostridia bacterium]|nr:hypothetical protein [Clostridia bacterium]
MLNDLIKKANVLACDADKSPDVASEYERVLNETLSFISSNNIPRDTVVIIENRLCAEIAKERAEHDIKVALAKAKAELDRARKNEAWYARAVNTGKGYAETVYLECRAHKDDVGIEVSRTKGAARQAAIAKYLEADKLFQEAREEFKRVGNTDKDRLLSAYNEARAKAQECEKTFKGLQDQLRAGTNVDFVPGNGVIARTLGVKTSPHKEVASGAVYAFDEYPVHLEDDVLLGEVVEEDEEEKIYSGVPVEYSSSWNNDDVSVQVAGIVNNILNDNERFKFILEEVRFQASLEVAKIREEVEKIKNEAMQEVRALMQELRQLKSDAAYLRMEANRAQAAAGALDKARSTATLNAKRTAVAARKTIAAARKAIDAARDMRGY